MRSKKRNLIRIFLTAICLTAVLLSAPTVVWVILDSIQCMLHQIEPIQWEILVEWSLVQAPPHQTAKKKYTQKTERERALSLQLVVPYLICTEQQFRELRKSRTQIASLYLTEVQKGQGQLQKREKLTDQQLNISSLWITKIRKDKSLIRNRRKLIDRIREHLNHLIRHVTVQRE